MTMTYTLPDAVQTERESRGLSFRELRRLAPGFFKSVERGHPQATLEFLAKDPCLARLSRPFHNGRETALGFASRLDAVEMVLALLPFSDPNEPSHSGRSLLFEAIDNHAFDAARAILPFADPAALDSDGRNASLAAASAGCLELLREAVPRCDPNAADEDGRDALMLAADSGSLECLQFLFDFCDPRATEPLGFSAIFFAASHANADCVAALLPRSSLGAANELGVTPLMLAANRRHSSAAESLRLLLPASDPEARDRGGRRAFDFAVRGRIPALVDEFAPSLSRQELSDFLAAWPAENGDLPQMRALFEARELGGVVSSASPWAAPADGRGRGRRPKSL